MIPRIVQDLARHAPEFRRALANHKWEATDDGGLLFPEQRAIARGYFTLSVNGGPDELSPNMLVTEGLNKILDVHYRAQTPITACLHGGQRFSGGRSRHLRGDPRDQLVRSLGVLAGR